MSGKPLEDRERLDQHLRAELRLPLEVLVGELPKEPHELAYAAELRKEGSVRVVSHEDAHALQHSQLAVPGLKALPICLREEPLLHQQLEYHAEALARMLEGRGAAEVVPLAVLQEKIVELLLFVSRRLSQQLAEAGGHCDGHTACRCLRADLSVRRRRCAKPFALEVSCNCVFYTHPVTLARGSQSQVAPNIVRWKHPHASFQPQWCATATHRSIGSGR